MIRSALIIDDQPEAQEILRACLEGIPGWKVSGTARNGWEARVELSRRRPDLLLLDEVLPGESSSDLADEWAPLGIPLLLVTGILEDDRPMPGKAFARIEKPTWKTLEVDRNYLESLFNQLFPPTSF